uniref:KpsF/GutQ family sugar-phosphate isomerase n=1 Tax=Castellaniella ginsengisoli TaxID=546114 RepID=UPI003F65AD8C
MDAAINIQSEYFESDLQVAYQTLDAEMESLRRMRGRLDRSFSRAVDIMLGAQGRVIIVGMGKSGLIGRKIAATLASTGTSAFFVHPGEAFHGDLGMIRPIDVALLISNSGETEEVLRILPFLEHRKNPIIAMTGGLRSTLARYADVVLDVGVEREACKNNLAPTSSTTNTLAMGDALAVALMVRRDFQPEDFAQFHPGGSLGRRLLTRVKDVMHKAPLPVCASDTPFREVVNVMTAGRLGLALVMDEKILKGIITDGDLRRAFERHESMKNVVAEQIMSRQPLTIQPEVRFTEAEALMNKNEISALVVQNQQGDVLGVLQIHGLKHQVSAL